MLLSNTMRLVVKGPKGVFTEKGGLVDPKKLCFPHYSCKDTINDFGFVTDFSIAVTKDRYMFFTAKPLETIKPSYEETLTTLAKCKEFEEICNSPDHQLVENKFYGIGSAYNYNDYMILLITIRYASYWFIVTKSAEDEELIYAIIASDVINHSSYENIICSRNINSAIHTMASTLMPKNEYNIYMDFIRWIISADSYQQSDEDLMRLFCLYRDTKLRRLYPDFDNTDNFSEICDKFFVKKLGLGFSECLAFRIVMFGKVISFEFNLIRDKLYCDKIKSFIDKIGTERLSNIVQDMINDSSFPRIDEGTDSIPYYDTGNNHLVMEAYKDGYITFVSPQTGVGKLYSKFIRWNALSDFKNYKHFKEVNAIIKQEEVDVKTSIKALGKIRTEEAIKQLKELATLTAIYKID